MWEIWHKILFMLRNFSNSFLNIRITNAPHLLTKKPHQSRNQLKGRSTILLLCTFIDRHRCFLFQIFFSDLPLSDRSSFSVFFLPLAHCTVFRTNFLHGPRKLGCLQEWPGKFRVHRICGSDYRKETGRHLRDQLRPRRTTHHTDLFRAGRHYVWDVRVGTDGCTTGWPADERGGGTPKWRLPTWRWASCCSRCLKCILFMGDGQHAVDLRSKDCDKRASMMSCRLLHCLHSGLPVVCLVAHSFR